VKEGGYDVVMRRADLMSQLREFYSTATEDIDSALTAADREGVEPAPESAAPELPEQEMSAGELWEKLKASYKEKLLVEEVREGVC
jgi:hypothetical protein